MLVLHRVKYRVGKMSNREAQQFPLQMTHSSGTVSVPLATYLAPICAPMFSNMSKLWHQYSLVLQMRMYTWNHVLDISNTEDAENLKCWMQCYSWGRFPQLFWVKKASWVFSGSLSNNHFEYPQTVKDVWRVYVRFGWRSGQPWGHVQGHGSVARAIRHFCLQAQQFVI